MAKIDINKVAEILKRNQVDPSLLKRVVEEMNLAAQAEGPDEDAPPPVKKQWAIVVSDPDNLMPKNDLVGWVVQIPEDKSILSTMERIHNAAYEFQASKKGKLLPVKTVGETLEAVPAKYFKDVELWVKTKTPVLVIKTDNEIPKDQQTKRKSG